MVERCSHPLVIPLLDTHTHNHILVWTHTCSREQHVLISPMTQTTVADRRCYMTETCWIPLSGQMTALNLNNHSAFPWKSFSWPREKKNLIRFCGASLQHNAANISFGQPPPQCYVSQNILNILYEMWTLYFSCHWEPRGQLRLTLCNGLAVCTQALSLTTANATLDKGLVKKPAINPSYITATTKQQQKKREQKLLDTHWWHHKCGPKTVWPKRNVPSVLLVLTEVSLQTDTLEWKPNSG